MDSLAILRFPSPFIRGVRLYQKQTNAKEVSSSEAALLDFNLHSTSPFLSDLGLTDPVLVTYFL